MGLGASGGLRGMTAGREGFTRRGRFWHGDGTGLPGGRAGWEALAGVGELRQVGRRPNDKPKWDYFFF